MPASVRVLLDVITMHGTRFVLFPRDGAPPAFPHGALAAGERPQDAVRALVADWTGTSEPKLELVDLTPVEGDLRLVFRALLTADPTTEHVTTDRMELPEQVGDLTAAYVRAALSTSLGYKLTRDGVTPG